MKKTCKLILIACLLLVSFAACKPKQEKANELEKVIVTLDWTPNTNHTGLYVAQELGYFADEGLEVQIMQPGQAITDQVVAAGNSHFGISYQENVIRARSEGIPIVSVAAVIQHNTSGFASLKEAGIKTPKDFEGKRYGSWDSPSEMAILQNVMKSAKADISKVTIVSGVYDFFSTIGKEADLEWIYFGWDGVEAQRRNIELNYIPLRDLNPIFDYYTPVIITNEDMITTNPDLITKFIRAVYKGYEFCISDPEKAAAIMTKLVPELDPELVKLSQMYLQGQYKAEAPKWGIQKESVWSDFSDWMYQNRLIPNAVVVNKAFTNEFLP